MSFKGILRDYQAPVVEKFISHVKSKSTLGGLLELPCAWGKTSASLYICSQLKKKTLVEVLKKDLIKIKKSKIFNLFYLQVVSQNSCGSGLWLLTINIARG